MARALVNVPPKVRAGDLVEIKALVQHPMETGFRTGPDGQLVPRHIISRFLCTFEGAEVFSADLHPAVAANPFLSFTMRATSSGTLTLRWFDDRGGGQVETAAIVVE
ncbi:MAG: thiosulfate oxidation carrier complex protein SoxZ [Alsobacter sp.]